MEEIKGYVEHIVYRNEDNGYTVFNLNNEDGDLTCVGTFLYIEEGELLKLTGEYVNHSLYGLQLSVSESRGMRTGRSDVDRAISGLRGNPWSRRCTGRADCAKV